MAGLYLHIPFCRKACHYCDFHFSTSLAQKERMVQCILEEMRMRSQSEHYSPLQTVYFGGGTPSVLSQSELSQLLEEADKLWGIANDAEITLEANPDDLSQEKLQALKQAGINRLSIGVQSFDQAQLEGMNRSHNSQQSLACLENALEVGFTNISADLIFALPNLSDAQLQADAKQLVELGILHISAYCLTVEEGTVLHHRVQKGLISEMPDGAAQGQFLLLHQQLTAADYEHYEVSNYALPNQRSAHNSAYWKGDRYIAVGPSAHGFDGQQRYWNIANNGAYMKALEAKNLPTESEKLSQKDRYNEYIMTHLRKVEGIDTQHIKDSFGLDLNEQFQVELKEALDEYWLEKTATGYRMTVEGWFMSDRVAGGLFWV